MNQAQLITTTQQYLDDPRGVRWHRPQVLNFVNLAMHDVERLIETTDPDYFVGTICYQVVPATDYEFDLPADYKTVVTFERLVPGARPQPITFVPFRFRHSGSNDLPLDYYQNEATDTAYIRGPKIGLVKPTTTYEARLVYRRFLAELDDENDVPEIPASFHDLIALGAAKRAAGSQGRTFSPTLEEIRSEQAARLVATIHAATEGPAPTYGNVASDYGE